MTYDNLSLIPAPIDLVSYEAEPIESGLLDLPMDDQFQILGYTNEEIIQLIETSPANVDYVSEVI